MTELNFSDDVRKQIDFSRQCSILDKRICVVLTAYNDEFSIPFAVKEFFSQKNVVDVIVVDNNSLDSTFWVAQNAGAKVVRESNQGYGFAFSAV